MKKLRITFISPYPPKEGGLSEYTKRNIKILNTFEDVETAVIPFNSFGDIVKIAQLHKTRPDVVRLEFNIPAYGLASLLLPPIIAIYRTLTKIIFVVNYHEVKRETDLLGPIGRWYYTIFALLFQHIYVHTNEAKKILIIQCKVEEKKISVLPHGLYHPKPSTITEKEFNKKYGLNNKKMILFFGYVHPDKGIEHLVEAIKLLRDQEPKTSKQIQVLIAGGVRKRAGIFKFFERVDQKYSKNISNLIQEYGLTEIISRLSYIDENDVDALLKKATAYVLPYMNAEQSGVLNLLIPYEKPIIASKIAGLKETLQSVGQLVPKGDPLAIKNEIATIFKALENRENCTKQYRSLAKKLSVNEILKNFIGELLNLKQKS